MFKYNFVYGFNNLSPRAGLVECSFVQIVRQKVRSGRPYLSRLVKDDAQDRRRYKFM